MFLFYPFTAGKFAHLRIKSHLRIHTLSRKGFLWKIWGFTMCLSVSPQVLNTPSYISRPFSASVYLCNPPHPPVRRLDRTSFTNSARLVSLVLASSPSLHLSLLSCLFCLCPSPLFLLFSNKNNRLWNAFSCGITHRHQPPHAIRLSRGRERIVGRRRFGHSMPAI